MLVGKRINSSKETPVPTFRLAIRPTKLVAFSIIKGGSSASLRHPRNAKESKL